MVRQRDDSEYDEDCFHCPSVAFFSSTIIFCRKISSKFELAFEIKNINSLLMISWFTTMLKIVNDVSFMQESFFQAKSQHELSKLILSLSWAKIPTTFLLCIVDDMIFHTVWNGLLNSILQPQRIRPKMANAAKPPPSHLHQFCTNSNYSIESY